MWRCFFVITSTTSFGNCRMTGPNRTAKGFEKNTGKFTRRGWGPVDA